MNVLAPDARQREVDSDALQRALDEARTDPDQAMHLALMLSRGDDLGEVAAHAASCLQIDHLRLKPWQCPPCQTLNVDTASDCYGYRLDEIRLLKKMLSLGLSRYEFNPAAAIERAEQRKAPPKRG